MTVSQQSERSIGRIAQDEVDSIDRAERVALQETLDREGAAMTDRETSESRIYYWSATVDGEVAVTLQGDFRSEEDWEYAARCEIELRGGPPVEYNVDLEQVVR